MGWSYKIVFGTASAFFVAIAHVLLAVLLLFGCSSETLLFNDELEEFEPEFRGHINVEFPDFNSCPPGWTKEELDAGYDYRVPYCKPPNISELNLESSLSPSPPNFLPCPSGWTEVEDVRTGLMTCHPYLWSRWSRSLRWR